MAENEFYTIKEVAQKTGYTAFYIRKCIRDGHIPTEMRTVPGTENVQRHEISAEALNTWLNREKKQVGKREDGRQKWNLYSADHTELVQHFGSETKVNELLASGLLKRANPPKSK